MSKVYVVARSAKTGRPGCQHIISFASRDSVALCGYDFGNVSRSYMSQPLDAILCKHYERCDV